MPTDVTGRCSHSGERTHGPAPGESRSSRARAFTGASRDPPRLLLDGYPNGEHP